MSDDLDDSSFARVIAGPEDLSKDDIKIARSYWNQAIASIHKSVRPSSEKLDEEEFQSFLQFIFNNWSLVQLPDKVTKKRKTVQMTSLVVGQWLHDVPKSKHAQNEGDNGEKKPVAIWKRKGSDAYCRPEIISGTIVFKITDSHSTMHNYEDVRWAYRGGLSTAVKIRICAQFDTNEIAHVKDHNLRAARSLTQAHLRHTHILTADPLEPMRRPDVSFLTMNLRLPLWKSMAREAKEGKRLAKAELRKIKKSYKI